MKIDANCPRYGIVDFGKGPVEIRCTKTVPHQIHKCEVVMTDDLRSNSLRKETKRG